MTDLHIEVEVSDDWWQKNKDNLAETFVERAYTDRKSYGQSVWIMRFGPFSLPRNKAGNWDESRNDKLKEMQSLLDMLAGAQHIRGQPKITSKPF